MNNIHSDKYNLAVNASESSSMTYTYLRKINKKKPRKIFSDTLQQCFTACVYYRGFLNVDIENLSLFMFRKSVNFSYLSMVLRVTADNH